MHLKHKRRNGRQGGRTITINRPSAIYKVVWGGRTLIRQCCTRNSDNMPKLTCGKDYNPLLCGGLDVSPCECRPPCPMFRLDHPASLTIALTVDGPPRSYSALTFTRPRDAS